MTFAISKEMFEAQRSPRFGSANPERMHFEFWEWMIGGGGAVARCPGLVREKYGVTIEDGERRNPIWCFNRMGGSRTCLPDGREICVGGEYEDFYDPDFYIYNDVVVISPNNSIEIYGYPEACFAPTDFHTATLTNTGIVIIGRLGDIEKRQYGQTPIYLLDTENYQITQLPSHGEAPGWIYGHHAELTPEGLIRVRGGKVVSSPSIHAPEVHKINMEIFEYDPQASEWRQITHYNLQQFSIMQESTHGFVLDKCPDWVDVTPDAAENVHAVKGCENIAFAIHDKPWFISFGIMEISVMTSSDTPPDSVRLVIEEILHKLEVVIQAKCVIQRQ